MDARVWAVSASTGVSMMNLSDSVSNMTDTFRSVKPDRSVAARDLICSVAIS